MDSSPVVGAEGSELEEESVVAKHNSCAALFNTYRWVTVGVTKIIQVFELVLVGARYVRHDMMILFLLQLADMAPDSVHRADGVKLGIDSDILLLGNVVLHENLYNVGAVNCLDGHIVAQKLSHSQFHLIFEILYVMHSAHSIQVFEINGFKPQS